MQRHAWQKPLKWQCRFLLKQMNCNRTLDLKAHWRPVWRQPQVWIHTELWSSVFTYISSQFSGQYVWYIITSIWNSAHCLCGLRLWDDPVFRRGFMLHRAAPQSTVAPMKLWVGATVALIHSIFAQRPVFSRTQSKSWEPAVRAFCKKSNESLQSHLGVIGYSLGSNNYSIVMNARTWRTTWPSSRWTHLTPTANASISLKVEVRSAVSVALLQSSAYLYNIRGGKWGKCCTWKPQMAWNGTDLKCNLPGNVSQSQSHKDDVYLSKTRQLSVLRTECGHIQSACAVPRGSGVHLPPR